MNGGKKEIVILEKTEKYKIYQDRGNKKYTLPSKKNQFSEKIV